MMEAHRQLNSGKKKEDIMSARSISKDSATYLPNADDRKRLIDIKEALSGLGGKAQGDVDDAFGNVAAQEDFPVAMLKVPGSQPRPLTPELADVLLKVADQLSRGRAVFIAPYNTQLTTQEAADFLGISRPTLVKLLENGTIPFEKVGRHRRVLLSDLQQYVGRRHAENIQAFDEIAADEDPRATLINPLVS